jgi:xanthine dehydrogenase accessory factor
MNDDLLRSISSCLDGGTPCALATVVHATGSVPRAPGAKMLILADGKLVGTVGGGALEHAVIEAAREVLRTGEPQLLSYDLRPDLGMTCGGGAQVFVEPMIPSDRLLLFGAGHVGRALYPVARALGFSVSLLDDRPELATAEAFPGTCRIVHSFDEAAFLPFVEGSYCVVVTKSHAIDTAIVRALLGARPRYVGMIGSTNKRRAVERALAEAGTPPERISLLHTPIGVSIAAETPEEIAVSIAAELVATRRGAPASN